MLLVAISLSDHAYCIMILIGILLNLVLSIEILIRAIKHKVSILYIFFLTIFFMGVVWWSVGIEYINWLFTGNLHPYGFLAELNVIAMIIAFLAWLILYMRTIHPLRQKSLILILTIYGIISIAFFIYIIYYLRLAPGAPIKSMLGYEVTPFISESSEITIYYTLLILITVLVTGLHFSIKSMRVQDNPEVQWRGRFLFISFILFFIGEMGFMSILFGNEFAMFTVLILTISRIFFYIGFIMPEFVKQFLNLEE